MCCIPMLTKSKYEQKIPSACCLHEDNERMPVNECPIKFVSARRVCGKAKCPQLSHPKLDKCRRNPNGCHLYFYGNP